MSITHIDNITFIDDCSAVCQDCLENNYFHCSFCEEYYPNHQRHIAVEMWRFWNWYLWNLQNWSLFRVRWLAMTAPLWPFRAFWRFTAYDSDENKLVICPHLSSLSWILLRLLQRVKSAKKCSTNPLCLKVSALNAAKERRGFHENFWRV